MAENFQNLMTDLEIHIHKANRSPYYLNADTLPKTHYNETVKINDKES